MKFYDRKIELDELQRTRAIAFEQHSQMTAVMGRRRIGKTKLVMRSCEGTTMLYLFVARTTEAELCKAFSAAIREALGEFVPDGITSVVQLFEEAMRMGRERCFTLFFDEFQEFFKINPTIFSGIQQVWDRYKDTTHVNFIAAGSLQTMMHRVFLDYGQPLYGRCDSILRLEPFAPSVLKEIMADYAPGYSNDDLLALYCVTGGVPRYVEILADRGALSVDAIIDFVIRPNSIFIEEGNVLLIQEFGKDFGNYYSILGCIAAGHNTAPQISQMTGIESVGGLLERLEKDYRLVTPVRPVMAKPRSKTVRYELTDCFLRFWFRYIVKYQSYIQHGMVEQVARMAREDYPTYSGRMLERYFRARLAEERRYYLIGGWWKNGADPCEIDIVAVEPGDTVALVAEVKRNRANLKPEAFAAKVEAFRQGVLPHANITPVCLTLDDM